MPTLSVTALSVTLKGPKSNAMSLLFSILIFTLKISATAKNQFAQSVFELIFFLKGYNIFSKNEGFIIRKLRPPQVEVTPLNESACNYCRVCISRPELHGTELVPLLSTILNQCDDNQRSVAASFALQGITALCQADIVDVITTWKVLAPKLSKDTRTTVIIR